ncbi:MAG: MBL fold metallo-hydrolase [Planctomycetota bacterium]|jgi:glyoxylase-like metal-dependent hydrolase (beta-lactamase superfamily II)/rhodanese-related sulfurtransferase
MRNEYSIISFVAENCHSYMIAASKQALIIDPHISLVEQYTRKLTKKSLSLVGIVDTHTHADHISSSSLLKKRYDVPMYMSENAVSFFADEKLKENDVIKVGETEVKVLYTPGHTDDSISLLTQHGDLFTGDVLLINSVGRTDFQNGSPEDMYDSLKKLAALPERTVVRPAHDYKGNKTSTIAKERLNNPFLLEKDKNTFCDHARSKKLTKPANMDTIISANQKGSAEGFSTVSAKEAFEKLSKPNSVLLDVRTTQELDEISIKTDNVKHIPILSLASSISSMSAELSYYVLCRTGHRATIAAMSLIQNGFVNVAVIEGGINAWDKAKLPTKKTSGPISLERQVRIIAGGLILVGSLLSIVNIWFVVIPIWVGAGLVFAGVSNNCLMGLLLMKLPFNRKPPSAGNGACAMDGGGCSM